MGLDTLLDKEHIWLAIGFAGQALFTARFLVQWLVSEKQKQSVVPVAFWYFSIGGGMLLFAYSLYRLDPVFIAGQSLGVFVYSRNLYLIHKAAQASVATPSEGASAN